MNARPGFGAADCHCSPLRPPDDGSGQLQRRGQTRLARDDEFEWQLDGRLGFRQQGVEAIDHLGRHAGVAGLAAVDRLGRGREFGPHHEQLALEAQDQLGQSGQRPGQAAVRGLHAQFGSGEPQRRDRFVDGAVGLGPRIVLVDALAAEEQTGGAVVATTSGHR